LLDAERLLARGLQLAEFIACSMLKGYLLATYSLLSLLLARGLQLAEFTACSMLKGYLLAAYSLLSLLLAAC